MNISLRMMQESDLPAVVAIENRWTYLSKWGIPGFHSALNHPQTYQCLVAEVFHSADSKDRIKPEIVETGKSGNPLLAGFAVLGLMTDHAELCDIVVPPEFLAQGVGQALLDQCIRLTLEREIPVLFLEVRQSNQRAIRFYQKNGFEIISSRKNYYANPHEDAWIMQKKWARLNQPLALDFGG
jgi:ribosomal-protein-alanine acetyltransferase